MGTQNKLDNYRQLMISIMKMAKAECEENMSSDYDEGVVAGLNIAIYKLEASAFLTEEDN